MPVENSVILPDGVILPILSVFVSVNQRLPSGPVVMPAGPALPVMPVENSVTVPDGVILPILFAPYSVNQTFPSGPAVIPNGELDAVIPVENSVTVPIAADSPPPADTPTATTRTMPTST